MPSMTTQEVTMHSHRRTHRTLRRLARVWSEMDDAQRRLFEIQTGIRTARRPPSSQGRA